MKTARDLTRAELETIVETAQRAFWGFNGGFEPDTEWNWDRVEQIAGVMSDAGLRPEAGIAR